MDFEPFEEERNPPRSHFRDGFFCMTGMPSVCGASPCSAAFLDRSAACFSLSRKLNAMSTLHRSQWSIVRIAQS